MKNIQSNGGASATADVAPAAVTVRSDGSIELFRPVLQLHGHLFINERDSRTQLDTWKPERAVIVGNVVLIEEWDLLIPLAYVKVARWSPTEKKEKVS